VYEASGKIGAFNQDIKPIRQGMEVCGPALTVLCMGADNLMIHKALDIAQPNDIIVISVAGDSNVGFWGDVLTTAARARKIGGLVIDGCVRDRDEIVELGFPVFSRGLSIRGTTKNGLGLINHPMACAGALVWPGDLILGDSDGIVCVSRNCLPDILQKSQARDREESEEKTNLSKGIESTFTLYGFDKITERLGLLER
jgi:4-hydroxy-4-methyl-2-oxoglutarate aldolase